MCDIKLKIKAELPQLFGLNSSLNGLHLGIKFSSAALWSLLVIDEKILQYISEVVGTVGKIFRLSQISSESKTAGQCMLIYS